jgi:fatty acid amide hydrolase 2
VLNETRDLSVTRMSGVALASAIRQRRVSARTVVEAHIAVLESTQFRTNALAVPRFEAALSEADAHILRAGNDDELPELLGVPCTIKEMIGVEGMPHTAGLLSRRHHRAARPAPAAQRLLDAGAIVLGLTNVAELGIWIESNNRVYGLTRNAYDRRRTAGGSSGGEAVAVGVGGSPVGLGSDMGGSIRIPAFFNGVFGHKPSAGLVPNTGMFPDGIGDIGRLLTIGPIARYAEDLMPLLRIIAGPDGHDPFTRSLTLGDPACVSIQGLTVAVSEKTTYLPVAKDVRDARERVVNALAAAGAHIRRVPLRSIRRATEAFLATSAEVGGSLEEIITKAGSPPITVKAILRRTGGHNLMTLLAIIGERLPGTDRRMRRAQAAGRALREEITAVIGDGVLLHPPFARTAPRLHTTTMRPWLQTPCSVFNLAGVPVTQVPLGLNSRGLPLGVQVAASHGQDHLTISVAQHLERTLAGWVPPPPSGT